ncbi:UNVERIFIED_CONTAM: Dynamin-related protein 3A [Sesamum angustifolium]|uniref:Dynamin-related protein 3A n=1 Tax=Sesamum angustifolium TaxID=2727405 RepID=A0AAW2QD43_9LAMI
MAEDQATASASSAAAASLGHSVIPIVNKLQDIFAQLGSQSTIELPQVAVVGSQSSGKSSVLEALVGRDFLPRGNDICTRRPLVLQLVQRKRKADGTDEEWGEFLHLPGKKFFDFNEIRWEIQAETDREAGGNKGVSDKQIRLKIFSPNVLDITLVDLPGLTKVPVGDQPSDIEARIRTMIMSYIKLPSCLILAVTPANSDLANSDALQMAGIADPDGYRTIGVITKLDIMDRGTDARNFLLGKVIPLRLGYVGVVNRSQEDILMNRTIKDALIAEEKFFRSRPVYSDLAERCGVPQLAKKLNQILVQHIKTVLPGLKSRISAALVSVAKEHASYGEITESKAGQGALLLNILSKYSEAFSSMIEGKNEEMSTSELSGGARIHYIFQNIFVKSLEDVDPCEDLTDDDIRTAIQNATGPKSALFVPEVPFEVLVRRQIARLLDPSLQCARFIYDELIKMDYINTSHPNFLGGSKAVEMALQQVKSSRIAASNARQKGVRLAADAEKTTPAVSNAGSSWGISAFFGGHDNRASVRENSISKPFNEPVQSMEQGSLMIHLREIKRLLRITVTKLLLRSYYDIVRKNIEDSVPKAIMHFLSKTRDNLFEEMLQEPDEVSMKRKRTRDTLRVLQQAFRTLDELPLEAETVERGTAWVRTQQAYRRFTGFQPHLCTTPVVVQLNHIARPPKPQSHASLHIPGSCTHHYCTPVVDLQEFIYIVKIGIGTFKTKSSFKEFYLDMDTGSCFTWMQCQGCKKCFKQKPKPFPRNNLEMAPTLPGSP